MSSSIFSVHWLNFFMYFLFQLNNTFIAQDTYFSGKKKSFSSDSATTGVSNMDENDRSSSPKLESGKNYQKCQISVKKY